LPYGLNQHMGRKRKQWQYWRQSYCMYNQRYLGIRGAVEREEDKKQPWDIWLLCARQTIQNVLSMRSDVQFCNA
jgi:hypothetical protein